MKTKILILALVTMLMGAELSAQKLQVGLEAGPTLTMPHFIKGTLDPGYFETKSGMNANIFLMGRYNFNPQWALTVGAGVVGNKYSITQYNLGHEKVDGKVYLSPGLSTVTFRAQAEYSIPVSPKFSFAISGGLNCGSTHLSSFSAGSSLALNEKYNNSTDTVYSSFESTFTSGGRVTTISPVAGIRFSNTKRGLIHYTLALEYIPGLGASYPMTYDYSVTADNQTNRFNFTNDPALHTIALRLGWYPNFCKKDKI